MPFQEHDIYDDDYSDFNTDSNKFNSRKRLQDIVMNVGECSYRCIRITFYTFNLFFWIVGFLILFVAIWIMVTRREVAAASFVNASNPGGYMSSPILLTVIGLLTLLMSFLACCGSRQNNVLLLSAYSVLLLMITAAECGLVVLAYSYRGHIQMTLYNNIRETLNHYGTLGHETLTSTIDSVQQEYKCCGNQGYMDWFDTKWWQLTEGNFSVPKSCCIMPRMKNCNKDINESKLDLIFANGCYDYIQKFLLENLHIISGFGVWLVVLEFLGIIFSVVLIVKIKKEEKFFNKSQDEIYSMKTVDY